MEGDKCMLLSFSTQEDEDINSSDSSAITGIATCKDGSYLVVDNALGYAKLYDTEGSFLRQVGTSHLTTPWDAFCTKSGKIVISDSSNAALKLFDIQGEFITKTNFATYIKEPCGIAYDLSTGQSVVTDKGSSCAWIHNANGTVSHLLKVPDDIRNVIQLQAPTYAAYDNDGNILITDASTDCVYAFTNSGDLLWTYGTSEADEESVLNAPAGICVDKDGHIFVADSQNCRIHVLDNEGQFLDYFLTWDDGLAEPQCLTLNHAGHLVVGEGNTGLVKVYQYC